MLIVPNNWSELQHYKDRSPPWIKLHKKLLDNYEFQSLPVASRALAPMLWLLASEQDGGRIDATPHKLAFRLRMTEEAVRDALKPLIDKDFFSVVQGDSSVLAEVERDARPEAEAEREAETKKEGEKKPRRAARSQLPDDFYPDATGIAALKGLSLEVELTAFTNHHKAEGSTMANWQAAFRKWVGNSHKWGKKPAAASGSSYQQHQQQRVAEFAPALAKRAASSPLTIIEEAPHVPAIASR